MSEQTTKHISHLARTIPPSGIRRYFDIAQQMEDIVSLGVGEPDFMTPWKICDAAISSFEHNTSYTSNAGLPSLRNAISQYLDQRFGTYYDPDHEVVVTSGVSEGLDVAIRATIDPGDEVLTVDPIFVSYAPCITMSGGVSVPVPCLEKDQFRLTPDAIMERITPKTKALVLNFPNNPTGAVMRREDLCSIADICVDHDLLVLSDEIYAEMTYEGDHVAVASIPELYDRTITLSGFSKAWAMTGFRVGYLCAPKELCQAALKIHQYVMMSAPTASQYGALEALRGELDDVREMIREYRLRRNMIVDGLVRAGLSCHMPQGAFYAFPSIESTGLSDIEFAERLIREAHVAAVPGSVFGPSGAGHIRCAYAVSRSDLSIALERISDFISSL
ncbi:MAG: aminotransferase class I/II-fold pyridoxal phosphate-dependent enzyme [Methanomicrobiales archaeon]|nr:aminotransferase class I/II-fold pyridoxal phosphate-dependent enzyme [Methanomicrobiales archaeon]